jgi:hypothetical protein
MKQHYEYSFTSDEEDRIESESTVYTSASDGLQLNSSVEGSDVDASVFTLRAMSDGSIRVYPLIDAGHSSHGIACFDISQLTHSETMEQAFDEVDPKTRYYNFLYELTNEYSTLRLPTVNFESLSQNTRADVPEIPDEFELQDPAQIALDRESTHERHSDELTDEKAATIAKSLKKLSPGDHVSFGGGIKSPTITGNSISHAPGEYFAGLIEFFSDDSTIEESDHDTESLKQYRSQNPAKSNLKNIEVAVSDHDSPPEHDIPILTINSQSTTVYGHSRELGLITDVTLKEPSHSAEYPCADYIAEIEWVCDPDPARV